MILIDDKPIAYGRRSKIFGINKKTVLKLYDKDFPIDKIKQEFNNTKVIESSHKLLVPKPIKLVTIKNQTGIIFERINGIALMDLFQKNPIKYFTYGDIIVKIHKKIHSIHITGLPRNQNALNVSSWLRGLPTQEQAFNNLISSSSRLNDKEKKILLGLLSKKHTPVLCHGDFHHGNIILTPKGEYYILDWMDAFVGDYILDIALTAVNAAVSDAPGHIPFLYRKVYDLLKKILALDKRYIDLYGGIDKKELKESLLLASAIHMARGEVGNIESHKKYFKNQFDRLAESI